jgi:hypothetical protein
MLARIFPEGDSYSLPSPVQNTASLDPGVFVVWVVEEVEEPIPVRIVTNCSKVSWLCFVVKLALALALVGIMRAWVGAGLIRDVHIAIDIATDIAIL